MQRPLLPALREGAGPHRQAVVLSGRVPRARSAPFCHREPMGRWVVFCAMVFFAVGCHGAAPPPVRTAPRPPPVAPPPPTADPCEVARARTGSVLAAPSAEIEARAAEHPEAVAARDAWHALTSPMRTCVPAGRGV